MRFLLIGNGPSALAREMGATIDAFDGAVVRFNHYLTKGFEKHVGSRTDVWATVGAYSEAVTYQHTERWWVQLDSSGSKEPSRIKLGCEKLPVGWNAIAKAQGVRYASSGLSIAAYLLHGGHEVALWGFDFMSSGRKHHYGDAVARGTNHSWWDEWRWFMTRLHDGRLSYLGWDRAKQGMPIVRQPEPCGTDKDPTMGRGPCQMGWYEWAAKRCEGLSVLDVGAGTCAGLRILEKGAQLASGMDVDPRLKGQHPELHIEPDLSGYHDRTYDVVVGMDVLEHVVDDRVLLAHMMRIARREVIISTPNGHRSQCANVAHCREYTIPLFANVFQPEELWSGAPDGHAHKTLLLERNGSVYRYHGAEGLENRNAVEVPIVLVGEIPIDMRFNETVDGEEWPHITAVFKKAAP